MLDWDKIPIFDFNKVVTVDRLHDFYFPGV